MSRFRPVHRTLSREERALHDAIKAKAAELEALFDQARDLRFPVRIAEPAQTTLKLGDLLASDVLEFDPAAEYFGEGMKALELAVMWTVKGLTSAPGTAEGNQIQAPSPMPKMTLVGSSGEVDVTPGDQFTDGSGMTWEVIGPSGHRVYSPSAPGGAIGVSCRHVAGEISSTWRAHMRDGVADWCGDSLATEIIRHRALAAG